MATAVPILCYHKVGLEEIEGRWLCIAPERLRSHVRFLKRRYQIVAASEWCDHQGPCAVLTFDDAYTSTIENGLPILTDEKVTATLFAVSQYVGGKSEWDGDRAAPLADLRLLQEAVEAGFEVGLHTRDHARMPELSKVDQVEQIATCQRDFDASGIRLDILAYPYGAWNGDSLAASQQCGLKYAYALGNSLAEKRSNPHAIPRIVMSYGDTTAMLVYKLYVRPTMRRIIRTRSSTAKNMQ